MDFGAAFVLICFFIGLITAAVYTYRVVSIKVNGIFSGSSVPLMSEDNGDGHRAFPTQKLLKISATIEKGAKAFLFAEYRFIAIFLVLFMVVVGLLSGGEHPWQAALAFIWGGLTSLLCGFLGMTIAVKANVRVAHEAVRGWGPCFNTAFEGGCVMGFALTSIGLMNLFILIYVMKAMISEEHQVWEPIAGYGLGGSTMALFGRVGGGIYTKAADVGADLVGKVEAGIPEDDPRNPAVIADNVGDNVGDIAGMGSDLFGSFGESTCAALVVAANAIITGNSDQAGSYLSQTDAQWFPLAVTGMGILVSLVTSVIPQLWKVTKSEDVERQLKVQLIASTVLMTPMAYLLAHKMLPESFTLLGIDTGATRIFGCVAAGLWAGLIIGLVTEYFTSHSFGPVREVADACNTGHATNVIFGIALGYKSVIVPVFALAVTIWASFKLGSQYGVAMAALGMLSTMSIGLAIDAYGPISDNAGGIAEMCELGEDIREKTDALDAAGNTTAAIGKGFAIGSATLVSLALFGAFTERSGICPASGKCQVNVQDPLVFAGLIVGVMLPYWFSALTMKSVGIAAQAMVKEVRRQFKEIPGIMEGTAEPEYEKCVAISTTASLYQMIAPGALVILSPIIVGYFFGKSCLAGLLTGATTSGVQIAISMSNTGGAWDNAKKYIEKGNFGGKNSPAHQAAVTGDTVGDPLKDTSGPSVNIVMKLMAIISLVFAGFFKDHGGLFLRLGGVAQEDT